MPGTRKFNLARLLLRIVVGVPVGLILVSFALSNTQSIRLTIWPTDLGVDLPLSIAILLAMSMSFLVGALWMWLAGTRERRRMRRVETLLRRKENTVQARLPPLASS